ncbi:hypothetical protein M972_112757 [Acetivibrio thermocellus AD2]|jgi:hypothetical protein|uniref:Uncharacterized protein n=1 Tax=Acetivibrio thermocellus AD2 TaxID=1138384 RepID=A0AB36TJJ3_ACETH|nr:hypothetical protein [Acetivibrio thermocellus]CDG36508.1 hypothetical protein CTHBC1_1896 [Acetivibrio thermocellus BC1]ADU75658.1 hypothetical protein Clo1313_2661 [Acetivibrio thermocellus DSM 1313]ALX09655.1 hypothetical protein AD2_02675 [Acetivibrio thermocellus AD2]ANV77428.1 hypothetical protein LQRI_2687 [Acetivibrio thermocellus DSM 2360]EIC03333.1 hypothetical protein YSBL_2991 [Acetivibrio thermocellus YS]
MSKDIRTVRPPVQLLPKAIIAVRPASTAKADLEVMAAQVAQLTTVCCQENIQVDSIIITFGGIKDITKRVKQLTEQKDISYLIIYSGKQIAENESEYVNFKRDMQDWYNLKVVCYR